MLSVSLSGEGGDGRCRKRIPGHAELHFVETVATGTVHIEVRVPVWATPDEPTEIITMGGGNGRFLQALLSTPTVTRCGQRTFPHHPGPDARHKFITRFRDERLCAVCYRTLPPNYRSKAGATICGLAYSRRHEVCRTGFDAAYQRSEGVPGTNLNGWPGHCVAVPPS